jgi:hypothetical protein
MKRRLASDDRLLTGGYRANHDANSDIQFVEPDSVSVTYEPAKGKWVAMINATKEQLPELKYEGRWKAS